MDIPGDGERKSTEPIAARACPDPKQINNVHSKLPFFGGRITSGMTAQFGWRWPSMPSSRISTLVPCRVGLLTTQDFSSRANTPWACREGGCAWRHRSCGRCIRRKHQICSAIRYLWSKLLGSLASALPVLSTTSRSIRKRRARIRDIRVTELFGSSVNRQRRSSEKQGLQRYNAEPPAFSVSRNVWFTFQT
jgi:hypothetical protein